MCGKRFLALCLLAALAPWSAALRAQQETPAPREATPEKPEWETDPQPCEKIRAKNPAPDRYWKYHELAAQGPPQKPVAATFFGGPDHEEFLGGGALPDGRLVAFGNAWGPTFPDAPALTLIGKGQHRGLKPVTLDKQVEKLRSDDPDMAGFIVCYKAGLKGVERVVRFDWGVASISAGQVTPDGTAFILTGRATEAFRGLKATARSFQIQPGGGKPYVYDGVNCTGDVFVARLEAQDLTLSWVWLLEGCSAPPAQLWLEKSGAVWFDAQGLSRISAAGDELRQPGKKTSSGQGKWLLVDPDGNSYYGGDRNTHTHKEPWRQPFLYKYDPAGNRLWRLWEFPPADVGADTNGLQADSSVRALALHPDGTLFAGGWSDGGNSVFTRLATNYKRYAPEAGWGMQPWWPLGACSYAHLMHLDPRTRETKSHQWWCAYWPPTFHTEQKRNRSSAATILRLAVLNDGAPAFAGGASVGLIQTPNAFWKDASKGEKWYSGEYAAVLSPDKQKIRFSSYFPGCSELRLVAVPKGLLVFSRSVGQDSADPVTKSPAINALQEFKGKTDAHVVLLENPE